MKLHVVKNSLGLHPFTDVDEEIIEGLKNGFYDCELKMPRNYKYHKKFFGMVKYIFMSQEEIQDFEEFKDELLIKAGYCTTFQMRVQGEKITVKKPRSISFAKCDQSEFESIYNRVLDIAILEYAFGDTADQVESKVLEYMSFG